MLFAESNLSQMTIIQCCLDIFCAATGAKVSLQKTKIFFSKNTHRDARKAIYDKSGFEEVPSLGKYLDMPIFTGKITKAAYSYIIDNIRKKLTAWRMNNLNFAGCITLIISVITSIPNYAMQSVPLSKGICHKIDMIMRGFLWGNLAEIAK